MSKHSMVNKRLSLRAMRHRPRAPKHAAANKRPHIAAAVEAAHLARLARFELKADDVLRELLRIGMSDVADAFDAHGNLLPIREMPRDLRRAVSSMEVIIKNAAAGDEHTDRIHKFRFGTRWRARDPRQAPRAAVGARPDGRRRRTQLEALTVVGSSIGAAAKRSGLVSARCVLGWSRTKTSAKDWQRSFATSSSIATCGSKSADKCRRWTPPGKEGSWCPSSAINIVGDG